MGIISVWGVQNYKEVVKSIETKDWGPVVKRSITLVVASLLAFGLPPVLPISSVVIGRILTACVISAIASDGLYPISKQLKGSDTTTVSIEPPVNPFNEVN
jgi:Na+-translocating ferredoxin:NAD+ oxidoreductase RnfD subunit